MASALAAVLASAVLCGLYARGGSAWVLGFVALVPWLLALHAARTWAATLALAYGLTVAYTAAVFPWLGAAIGRLAQVHELLGLFLLLLAAPLFQPQFLVLAGVRRLVRQRQGGVLAALAGAAAWVVAEAVLPRLLDDTLGHGLYPSREVRQAADLVGTAGLTLALLLANEALAGALARVRVRAQSQMQPQPQMQSQSQSQTQTQTQTQSAGTGRLRAMAPALALAAAVPLLLAGYGAVRLASLPQATGPTLRMGLVQSNLIDYERLRRERGSGAVVREVLDTHYAMSHDAVERQRAQAVLWSETVYPTTFGQPKSEAGAELDREIVGIVNAAGVPFVFGTYDSDAAGEYNAAAFVAPGQGLVGFYRKTRPFPFTEHVPAWLDGPGLRRWLPWAGQWQAGHGARVMPLRLADGRELPVLPLICLDAVDTALAIDGARQGARAILTMSNDAWFTEHPQGAALHQAVAAFRSIETRLPQFRVTTNGYSAVIDATGTVQASSRMGERTLVVGELPVPPPPHTWMVAWGNWVPWLCAAFLAVLAVLAGTGLAGAGRARPGGLGAWWGQHRLNPAPAAGAPASASAGASPSASSPSVAARLPGQVAVLSPAARAVVALLRLFARASLLWMAVTLLQGEHPQLASTLGQLRSFAALVLVPEAAAWLLLWSARATLAIEGQRLLLQRGARRVELAASAVAAVEVWRLPLPSAGLRLRLATGACWPHQLAGVDATALLHALQAAGSAAVLAGPAWAVAHAQAWAVAPRGRLYQPWARFGLLPLLLAWPAFRLHQHIAYGSSFGELQTYGPGAYLVGFALWWARWIIGVVLCAAVLRAVIEAVALCVVLWQPAHAVAARRALERLGLLALYVGLPAWLLLRVVAA